MHLEKAIKNFEVKVDAHKGILTFRGKIDNKCVGFIQFVFSSIVVIWEASPMTIMSILVKV